MLELGSKLSYFSEFLSYLLSICGLPNSLLRYQLQILILSQLMLMLWLLLTSKQFNSGLQQWS